MIIARTIPELREQLAKAKGRIGLVPTMGYLHGGHTSLIEEAVRQCDFVCVSVFVNPLQFNNPADLESYPVSEDRDFELAKKTGAALVFAPSQKEMYSELPKIQLSMPDLTKNMCGPFRPNHFEGVLLIVARLFNLFAPDRAFFGLKDYQQFRIVGRMIKDLNFPIELIGCPTIRESDGLAMSSRNANLAPNHREQAALVQRGLRLAEKSFRSGNRDPKDLAEIASDVMVSGPDNRVEYVEVVNPESLELLETLSDDFVIAAAIRCGQVRLIDNLQIKFAT